MRICDDLRQAVLQAAIQGKLTKQLPEDGDAADLLKQIAAEKDRLIKEGKIKKEKPLPEVSPDEIPFNIPDNWVWVRWGNLAKSIQYGFNAPGLKSGRIKMLRISDISANNTVNWENVPFCNIAEDDIESYLLHPNDLLFARTGGTVGKSFLIKELPAPSVYAGYLIRTNYNSALLSPQFLKYFMESLLYWRQLQAGTTKTAQPNCNGQTLSKMMIPLPPLAEQHRIVSRVEELMARIDDLEKTETELEKLKAAFPGDMKAALLQAAMQGKLTEQLPEDGDAADLINQIVKEKSRLIKEGKIKKEKPLDPIDANEVPFDIPETWKWAYIGDIFAHNAGKALNASNKTGKKHKYITTSNVYWDHFELNNLKEMYYTDDEIEKYSVKKGDLLVLEGGDIGRTAIWNLDESYCIQNHLHRLRPYVMVAVKYFYYCMMYFKSAGMVNGKGIAIQGLSSNALHSIVVPVPPLAEQKRIVEKLDKLLPLCDGLVEE